MLVDHLVGCGWISTIQWKKYDQPVCLVGHGFLCLWWRTRILSGFSVWTTEGVSGRKGRHPARGVPAGVAFTQFAALQPMGAEGEGAGTLPHPRPWPGSCHHLCSHARTRAWSRGTPSHTGVTSWVFVGGHVPRQALGRSRDGHWAQLPPCLPAGQLCPTLTGTRGALRKALLGLPTLPFSSAPSLAHLCAS